MIRAAVALLAIVLLAANRDAPRTVRIAAAGDIACDAAHGPSGGPNDPKARCHAAQTAALVKAMHPDAVLALGDLQYFGDELATFRTGYGASWGAFKSITHPVSGNHEYPDASGYYDYFGAAAGPRNAGWYSFDLGRWHLIALNGNCGDVTVGGCDSASAQYRWLVADLKRHPSGCKLAYWHQPRFSSGPHGNNSLYADFWSALYRAHADVVLAGHDHNYERFVPLDPREHRTPGGIREFIVGTGGRNHSPFFFPPHAESAVRDNTAFGVLEMTLAPAGYAWRFIGEPGSHFTDRGQAVCHRPSR